MPTNLKENIIKELAIDQLPPEKQQAVLASMTEAVLKRIIIKVLETLPADAKKEFEKVCASKDADQVTQFLKEKVPNYEQIALEEIANFKKEMRETVEKLIS